MAGKSEARVGCHKESSRQDASKSPRRSLGSPKEKRSPANTKKTRQLKLKTGKVDNSSGPQTAETNDKVTTVANPEPEKLDKSPRPADTNEDLSGLVSSSFSVTDCLTSSDVVLRIDHRTAMREDPRLTRTFPNPTEHQITSPRRHRMAHPHMLMW